MSFNRGYQSNQRRNNNCFKCNRPGHWAKNCYVGQRRTGGYSNNRSYSRRY